MKIRLNCAHFFLILKIKYFVLFCLLFRRSLPTQNLPQTSADLQPPKKEKERKHQKQRHKQRNITMTRQSSLIQ